MLPAASVSGLYFSHPQAKYFNVGRLGRDQIEIVRPPKGQAARGSREVARPEPGLRSGGRGRADHLNAGAPVGVCPVWPSACLTVSNPGRRQPTRAGGRLITGVNDASQGLLSLVDSHRGRAGQRGRRRRAFARTRSRESRIRTTGGDDRRATVTRQDFVRSVRLSGTVEAVESTTIAAPRLSGPNFSVPRHHQAHQAGHAGRKGRPRRRVRPADAARDRARSPRRAERSRAADPRRRTPASAPRGRATTARSCSPKARSRAPSSRRPRTSCCRRIQAEKNNHAVEQASATLKQLKTTYALKRKAAEADLRILQDPPRPRRERDAPGRDQRRADGGRRADRRHGRAPDGVEGQQPWRRSRKARRSAPACRSSTSSTRRRCGSARGSTRRTSTSFSVGQPVKIGLDAYPELSFDGRIAQISPLGGRLDAVAESARLHRADRRQRLASEPDARPDGVARRHAVAAAGRAGRAA